MIAIVQHNTNSCWFKCIVLFLTRKSLRQPVSPLTSLKWPLTKKASRVPISSWLTPPHSKLVDYVICPNLSCLFLSGRSLSKQSTQVFGGWKCFLWFVYFQLSVNVGDFDFAIFHSFLFMWEWKKQTESSSESICLSLTWVNKTEV